MGNRFSSLPEYHSIIKGHGILAVITFLIIVPAAILIAQFYSRNPRWALRTHIYLQILTVALSTVIFTLGWFAVGPERSLTNPHHGIGTAIYVLILWQGISGWWVHKRAEKHPNPRKLPVKLVLHQWLGRGTALLGFAQVPLGLTLYGCAKWMFILYALWMFFLLVLFFVLSYRAMPYLDGTVRESRYRESTHGGTVIEEKRTGWWAPLATGAVAATLLGRRKERSRSRTRRDDVVPSRRGSRHESVYDEKLEERKEGGGVVDKLLKGAALVGAAGLAKSWYDRRQKKKQADEYSSVAPDTPSRPPRRRPRPAESEFSDESIEVHRMEEGRRPGGILPGPGDPAMAAAALSATEPRPSTPRPNHRRDSYSSYTGSYDTRHSPSQKTAHKVEGGVLAALGLGFLAKRLKDRKDKKEADRLDRIERERLEEERYARKGNTPARFTGDSAPPSTFPSGRHGRRGSLTQSSDLSSVLDNPHTIRPGAIPPIPAALAGGAAGAALNHPSRSRHDITESVSMPPIPHDPQGVLHQEESGSESYMSAGGHNHRRHSAIRRAEGEAAAAAAVAEAANLARAEENRRRRSRSRATEQASEVTSAPVSVKVKVHGDKDRNVTLRRLTEEEAAAEREARRNERRRRRNDSLSSLSGTDTAASRRRYRRDERDSTSRVGSSNAPPPPPPAMPPLNPPNPAFAGGKRPKDSAYYSGRPGEASASNTVAYPVGTGGPASVESHGTWSAMSPSNLSGGDGVEAAAERRRRRRLERNTRGAAGGTTVDFT